MDKKDETPSVYNICAAACTKDKATVIAACAEYNIRATICAGSYHNTGMKDVEYCKGRAFCPLYRRYEERVYNLLSIWDHPHMQFQYVVQFRNCPYLIHMYDKDRLK